MTNCKNPLNRGYFLLQEAEMAKSFFFLLPPRNMESYVKNVRRHVRTVYVQMKVPDVHYQDSRCQKKTSHARSFCLEMQK